MRHLSFADEPDSIDGRPGSSSEDRRVPAIAAKAAEILAEVRAEMERSPEGARIATLRLIVLLTPRAWAGPAVARGGLASWQKRKVERYVKEHLGRPLQIKLLAQQVSLSVSHFCRAFKESFGATPHMHIIQLRLEQARQLMLTTQDPLSEIALRCGLADQAHLSKLFRRWVGETPNGWRRRNFSDLSSNRESAARLRD